MKSFQELEYPWFIFVLCGRKENVGVVVRELSLGGGARRGSVAAATVPWELVGNGGFHLLRNWKL